MPHMHSQVLSQISHLPRLFLLDTSIFPGSLQYLTSSLQPKYLASGAPFLCSSTKSNILPSTDPLSDPNISPRKGSAYSLSDQTNSTPTSTLRRDTSILTTVQSTMAPSRVPSSVPVF